LILVQLLFGIADADGAAASAPIPTVAAASAVSTSILSLFIASLLFT
jgi:hypothetical protein